MYFKSNHFIYYFLIKRKMKKNRFRYWRLFEKFQLKNHFFKRVSCVEKKRSHDLLNH